MEIDRDRPSSHHFIRYVVLIRGGRFDSDALPGSLMRPESPASSVRNGGVSAGKRKRSISHSPTRDLRLWSGCDPTRVLTEWMMKDVYVFPLSVNVDNILSAYGSKAWCWGGNHAHGSRNTRSGSMIAPIGAW